VLEESCRLLLDKLRNHVAQYRSNRVESLVGSANIIQPMIIKKDLLHNEYSHRLAQLRARLHDSKAERDDFGREEEVDDVGGIVLNKCTDNTERCQSQIFERSRLGGSVQERVQEQWDVSWAY